MSATSARLGPSSRASARLGGVGDARIECQANGLEGYPAVEIVRHAKQFGADLIVVGTHGRTGIAHALMGSVAERVVQRAPCPVLVVPQERNGH